MNLIHEYALLVAVCLPVVVIVGMQVALFMGGERGTLLMPGLFRFPSVAGGNALPKPVDTTPDPRGKLDGDHAANDAYAKEAA